MLMDFWKRILNCKIRFSKLIDNNLLFNLAEY